jgi:hypothetical protein
MYGPTAVCKREFWMDIGSRLYVSGLFIDIWVVALMGIRTHLDLISYQAFTGLMGSQILGAYFNPFHAVISVAI